MSHCPQKHTIVPGFSWRENTCLHEQVLPASPALPAAFLACGRPSSACPQTAGVQMLKSVAGMDFRLPALQLSVPRHRSACLALALPSATPFLSPSLSIVLHDTAASLRYFSFLIFFGTQGGTPKNILYISRWASNLDKSSTRMFCFRLPVWRNGQRIGLLIRGLWVRVPGQVSANFYYGLDNLIHFFFSFLFTFVFSFF